MSHSTLFQSCWLEPVLSSGYNRLLYDFSSGSEMTSVSYSVRHVFACDCIYNVEAFQNVMQSLLRCSSETPY